MEGKGKVREREESANWTGYMTEGGNRAATPTNQQRRDPLVVPPFDLMAEEFGKHYEKTVQRVLHTVTPPPSQKIYFLVMILIIRGGSVC